MKLLSSTQSLNALEVSNKALLNWKLEMETVPTPPDIIVRCADIMGNNWCLLRFSFSFSFSVSAYDVFALSRSASGKLLWFEDSEVLSSVMSDVTPVTDSFSISKLTKSIVLLRAFIVMSHIVLSKVAKRI